ncbi:cell division protein FtsQ/DivIB [endosymbiont of unidentified scaly snail isolate Monju]|uniref:cell division protein FtsQ/DivIB n=1 Tax=endosymbiont of unidentified scaly snail isolate Monju TaxID=1248727 RepID=UPI0003891B86|nr:cell division protein FtsQ/DivIB [endosymbiont of unidentified scaly snail isolate Monju]BAN68406.1 cell division protein FtsQ [endosymbiont of unidentified scaly snail isolate Monju]
MAARRPGKQAAAPRGRSGISLGLLSALLLVALVFAGWQALTRPDRLPVRRIEITGEFTHLRTADIERRVAQVLDGGFLDLDMRQVRAAVMALPWVDQVSVRRVWPDTLRMHVVEQVPLARWNEDALVNLRGQVFRPDPLPALDGLPRLRGEDGMAPEVVAFYLRLHAGGLPEGLEIAELARNQRGEWRVVFANRLELMLGREDLGARLAAFSRIYPQLAAHMGRRPRRIDMRYEHGFAVQWQPADEAQASLAGGGTGEI